MNAIQTFLTMRQRMQAFGESLTTEQLFCIPPGFNNNIAWNLGHLVVTHQVLCYRLSGLLMPMEERYLEFFGKDSSPESWSTPPDMDVFLPLITGLAQRYASDHAAGIFMNFEPYMTMVQVKLETLDEAFAFNQMHEGLHLGYAMAQRRALESAGTP